MSQKPISVLIGSGLAALLLGTGGMAQEAVEGVFALNGASAGVDGTMAVRETGTLGRALEFSYRDAASGEPVTEFEVELTQELHILAVDAGLSTLIHRHVEHGEDGRFAAELQFPRAGLYHVYTDAAPAGYGQQVLRFDLAVGEAQDGMGLAQEPVTVGDGPISVSEGGYEITVDASGLEAGGESALSLTVEKDGAPADDIMPYLGVAAHAVLIREEDLAYVHAHAMAGEEAHGRHGDHPAPAAAGHDVGAHHMHGAAAGTVEPDMSVLVTLPGPGDYAVWIEFMGGGDVVTVPFALTVPAR